MFLNNVLGLEYNSLCVFFIFFSFYKVKILRLNNLLPSIKYKLYFILHYLILSSNTMQDGSVKSAVSL